MNVVNAVTLKGNINDPNIMKNNVTRLRLCVDGYNNTKDWFDIVCFKELGIQASKLNKGDLISVEGRLKNDVYIKKNENGEDEKVYRTCVIANSVKVIFSKNGENDATN